MFLDGYTLVRSTSDLPYATLTPKHLTFTAESMHCLDDAPFVHFYINKEEKKFIVQATEKDRSSVPYVAVGPNGRALARWFARELLTPIREMIDDPEMRRYCRILGVHYPEEKAIVFDCTDLLPVEKTGK